MSNLDSEGERILATLADDKPEAFADVPATSGEDAARSLRLTVDAARRVTDVRVLDISRLRTPEAFKDALTEAFAAADGERLHASLRRAGRAEEWLARAEKILSGEAKPRFRQPTPREALTRDASTARRLARQRSGRQSRRHPDPVTSDNGAVRVHRSYRGDLLSVDVDAAWLSGARPEHLETAVLQATRFPTGA